MRLGFAGQQGATAEWLGVTGVASCAAKEIQGRRMQRPWQVLSLGRCTREVDFQRLGSMVQRPLYATGLKCLICSNTHARVYLLTRPCEMCNARVNI